MSIKRIATLVFLLAAAGMLVAGALLLPWWVGELSQGSFTVDLRGMRMCSEAVCGELKPLSTVDASAVGWAKLGISVFAAGLVAAALLLVALWKSVRRHPPSTFYWLAGAMALFTGLLASLFIWVRPEFGAWTPSYGLACTLAGSILGAVSASASAGVAKTEISKR